MPLRVGSVVFIDIPIVGNHPAVIVIDLGDGGYIAASGTGTPQDGEPTVSLSYSAASQCGLDKETRFYPGERYTWYWRPEANVYAVGNMLAGHLANLRRSANETLGSMTNHAAQLQKLPPHVGLTFSQVAKLRTLL